MRKIDKLADEKTKYVDTADQFYDERLVKHSQDEWPSRIDRAALDILLDVAIGSEDATDDLGGTIGKMDFGNATGEYYAKGLKKLADEQSDLPTLVTQYERKNDPSSIGDLVFRLNELRYELERHLSSEEEIRNLNRAVEALIDKVATASLSEEVRRTSLQRPESVTDAMIQLFSDPGIAAYAAALTETMNDISQSESFLERLDAPYMTTPLWEHQQEALQEWVEHECKGYVDMATATGKTVLGLSAVALLYGQLHPDDTAEIFPEIDDQGALERADYTHRLPSIADSEHARVLVVAGQELILEQWQSELDEHLNIPRERTQADGRKMSFTWGSIEFRTAPDLLQMETLAGYDLVILDEAHQYSRGGQSGGWRTVFEELAQKSGSILAMSGSIDTSWQGDSAVKRSLETHLHECKRFSVDEARATGVVADFEWEIFYAHADQSSSQDGLVDSTKSIKHVYDRENHKIRIDQLEGSVPSTVPDTFETLTDLRSFSQSKEGASAREASPAFDKLATDAFTRRPKRWHLFPPIETIVELIDYHAPEQQCVVLVQSYEQATLIGEQLEERYGEDLVLVPNKGASEQFAGIDQFRQKDRGVIIGPAGVLGVGVDLPNAEVAINLSKGGVNASLIQRIGRVLRNPTGEKKALFYQLVTLPSDSRGLLPGEDGRRLLRRASEFRALGARLRQLPGFDTADTETAATLQMLERYGADAVTKDHRPIEEIVEDEVAQAFLRELRDSITEQASDDDSADPVLPTFNGGAVDRQARPIAEAVKKHTSSSLSFHESEEKSDNDSSPSTEQSSTMVTNTLEIELPPPLHRLVERELESTNHPSLDELVDEITGEYVATHHTNNNPDPTSTDREVEIALSPHVERLIKVETGAETKDDVTEYVHKAVYQQLGLDTDPVSLEISLGSGLYRIISTIADTADVYDSPDEVITAAVNARFEPSSTHGDIDNNTSNHQTNPSGHQHEGYVIGFSNGTEIPQENNVHTSQKESIGAAIDYLLEEHNLADCIDIPYHNKSVGKQSLINVEPNRANGEKMNNPYRLVDGNYLQTTMGSTEKKSCLREIADKVGLDVSFNGKWGPS